MTQDTDIRAALMTKDIHQVGAIMKASPVSVFVSILSYLVPCLRLPVDWIAVEEIHDTCGAGIR